MIKEKYGTDRKPYRILVCMSEWVFGQVIMVEDSVLTNWKKGDAWIWDSESIHIPYISPKDNRWHNYYPDFYIKYIDKHDQIIKALIEIKPYFQKKWDVNIAKWDACQKHCDKKKMVFKVLTERELF